VKAREWNELLLVQDALGAFHKPGFAFFGAPFLVMLRDERIHLGFLFRSQVQIRQRNRARHFALVSGLHVAVTVFTRKHGACGEESRCH
jgi:hypothetical protein